MTAWAGGSVSSKCSGTSREAAARRRKAARATLPTSRTSGGPKRWSRLRPSGTLANGRGDSSLTEGWRRRAVGPGSAAAWRRSAGPVARPSRGRVPRSDRKVRCGGARPGEEGHASGACARRTGLAAAFRGRAPRLRTERRKPEGGEPQESWPARRRDGPPARLSRPWDPGGEGRRPTRGCEGRPRDQSAGRIEREQALERNGIPRGDRPSTAGGFVLPAWM